MRIYFNLNSQGNEKTEFFSQEIYDFGTYDQILGNETLIIAGYEDMKISLWLAVKVWLEEDDDLHTNDH